MMNNSLYDNGDCLLGQVSVIKKYIHDEFEDSEDYKIYICSDIVLDYIVYDANSNNTYYITCEDVSYYWYEDYTFLNKVEESD